MREIRLYGSVRGVRSNPYPYRDPPTADAEGSAKTSTPPPPSGRARTSPPLRSNRHTASAPIRPAPSRTRHAFAAGIGGGIAALSGTESRAETGPESTANRTRIRDHIWQLIGSGSRCGSAAQSPPRRTGNRPRIHDRIRQLSRRAYTPHRNFPTQAKKTA